MELTIGQEYYIKGCPEHYQRENMIKANYIRNQEYTIMIDDEPMVSVGLLISEDKRVWYPFTTLTDIIGG